MKNIRILYIFAFIALFLACKPQQKPLIFSSDIRPFQPLSYDTVYTDTLQYVETRSDSTLCLILRKDDNLIELLLDTELDFILVPDDLLEIQWKRDLPADTQKNIHSPEIILSITKIYPPLPDTSSHILKHYFKNNLIFGAFYADSTSFKATKDGFNSQYFHLEPDNIVPTNVEYEEWDTFLSFGLVDIWDFFDDWGHIVPGWEMIHYHRVFSPLQVTNFVTDISSVPPNKLKNIISSSIIFMPYTSKTPQRASSLEIIMESVDDELPQRAELNTKPVLDDHQKLLEQATQKYAAQDIMAVYLTENERYLSFSLYGNENIVIDITTDQNGLPYSALLYRVGYIPIIYNLKATEEDETLIAQYLENTDNKQRPFPSWKSMAKE